MRNFSTSKPILQKIMRMSLLQLCLALIFFGASFAHKSNAQQVLEQEISIKIKEQSLSKALKEISNQAGIKFVYSSKLIGTTKLVSVEAKQQKLSTVLNRILKPLAIEYVVNGEKIILNRKLTSSTDFSPNVETVEPLKLEIQSSETLPLKINLPKAPIVGTGTLQGKIVDATNGEALPGASILLKGTNKGGVTNLRGEYTISLLPSGEQAFTVSYIGYETQELKANIQADGITVLNVKMAEMGASLGEVVVRGSLEGQQKALNQQRTSDNIKNVISADLIGRFPDLNVAEALQRIPGINIERDRGEGGEVQMRGAPPSFTTININGEQIPGTQTDGQRNEELSLIPVDQLSSIEVTKAITSDMDGDNIGGTVDFRTPSGKNLQWKGKAELGGGYNNVVQRTSFIGKFGLNRRFLPTENLPDGRLGFNVGGSYFGSNLGRDRVTYNYTSQYTKINGKDYVLPTYYRLRDLENFRSRTGISAAMDYKFSPKSEIYFNYMYSRRYDFDEEARTQFDMNTARYVMDEATGLPTGNGATTTRRFINPRYNDVFNHSFSAGGVHKLGKATVDYLAFWSKSHNDAFIGRVYDLRSTAQATTFQGWGTDFANVIGTTDIHDPFAMRSIRNYTDQNQTIDGRNFAAKLNITVPYSIGDKSSSLKFGGKYRTLNNVRLIDNKRYNFANDGTVNVNSLFARYTSTREDNTFLKDKVRFGPTLDYERFDQFISANPNVWRFDENTSINESVPAFYDANESVFAAYVMNKLNINKLMILTGLRYEKTSVDYLSRAFEFNAQGNVKKESIRNINGGTGYDFFLPNVHLKYSVDEMTNIRAALTYSYARSNFADLAPTQQVNATNLTINLGNPDLKPASATNFDLLFERYFRNVGIISGGVFTKSIRNFNFDRGFTEERTVFVRDDATGSFIPFKETFSINQTQNGEKANVYGFELNLQTSLSFLPGILKGIGVYANYTYTNSKASTFDRKNVRLPGQAMHTGNAALSFDYKKLSLKGSFNFNGGLIRTLGPSGIGESGDFDIWRADRYQLDMSASYAITKKIRAYAEFINLTNRPDVEYFGIRSRVSNLEYYDWWNRFGLSYNF